MRTHRRTRVTVAALLAALALIVLQGMATATTGTSPAAPLAGGTGAQLTGPVEEIAPPATAVLQETEEEEGSSSDGASAQAYGQVVDVDVLDQDVATVSGSSSSASESDGSSSDATVLAVLGQEVAGAHAESDGSSSEDETGLLMETCEPSGGQICLGILYGYASSSDDDDSSEASSDTSVADVCLGGSDAERRPTEACDGPIHVSALDSHSDSSVDKESGRAEASESSDGARVCLGGYNEDGVCDGVGLRLLHSESSAWAERDGSDSDGDSYVVGVEQGGSGTYLITDEEHVDVPPGCPDASSVVCVGLNEGDSSADSEGGAGNSITIIHVDVLPGQNSGGDVGDGDVGEVGTGVTPGGGDDGSDDEPGDEVKPRGPLRRDPLPEAAPGVLPFTGAALSMFVVLSVIFVGAGSLLVDLARRRSKRVW